ncbi:hypothetical protein B0T26DRAFT_676092 [Lasiosphaeria miniovina]|uniref:Uncharacterized protein n=1 Tax=Lasiosphaeria miniovina TaxID=1954250 RepID=A0AA40AL49_9PEZI|nr:uncharacterized protein B0T26DRAFT_676092 [Lasiosphaeria miniovina]KAK0717842.1 hypothetical protein B0T26DRAFT_676092 [Lasiosphaeria miniovina]
MATATRATLATVATIATANRATHYRHYHPGYARMTLRSRVRGYSGVPRAHGPLWFALPRLVTHCKRRQVRRIKVVTMQEGGRGPLFIYVLRGSGPGRHGVA